MEAQSLYQKLKDSYSEANLNKLTSKIINLYKQKKYNTLIKLGKNIKGIVEIDTLKVNKLFSQLIMLYHPDRLKYYHNILDQYQCNKEHEDLNKYTHILLMQQALDKTALHDGFDYTELYASQVRYGIDEDDLDSIDHPDNDYVRNDVNPFTEDNLPYVDFVSLIERWEGIDFDVNSMAFHLEQLQGELDLSHTKLSELQGLEYCRNITELDLSYNKIIDISAITGLDLLKTLYLNNNNISDIEALGALAELRYLDLSFNDITDISVLLMNDKLEYINLIGNTIPKSQIVQFIEKKVFVVYG